MGAGIEKINRQELNGGKYIAEKLPGDNKADNRIGRSANKLLVLVSILTAQKKRNEGAAIQRRKRQEIKNK